MVLNFIFLINLFLFLVILFLIGSMAQWALLPTLRPISILLWSTTAAHQSKAQQRHLRPNDSSIAKAQSQASYPEKQFPASLPREDPLCTRPCPGLHGLRPTSTFSPTWAFSQSRSRPPVLACTHAKQQGSQLLLHPRAAACRKGHKSLHHDVHLVPATSDQLFPMHLVPVFSKIVDRPLAALFTRASVHGRV